MNARIHTCIGQCRVSRTREREWERERKKRRKEGEPIREIVKQQKKKLRNGSSL